MEEWNEECTILEKKEGAFAGMAGGDSIWKGNLAGASRLEEQQLQIQKGEHVSSPQSFECCWWSERC